MKRRVAQDVKSLRKGRAALDKRMLAQMDARHGSSIA
jgi:hypothetical protein